MKFSYVNQPSNEYDYHVARADIRTKDNILRMVAYADTRAEAETVLLSSIGPDDDIMDLGSV